MAWCERNAAKAARDNKAENAAGWAGLAGEIAEAFGSSFLVNVGIERTLRTLIVPAASAELSTFTSRPLRWLHVLTSSHQSGGHTALAARWIELDPSNDAHDCILTDQSVEMGAPKLLEAVSRRGGSVKSLLTECKGIVTRAKSLSARGSNYDGIVLHVHPRDSIPVIAFGAPGGPPLFFLDHADHVFWYGASIADVSLTLRPSSETMREKLRGIERGFRFALPLPLAKGRVGDESGIRLRAELGIATSSTMFLTIGSNFKYLPMPELSFMEAAAQILTQCETSYLVAVGPKNTDAEWDELRSTFGDRVKTVGIQNDLTSYISAANVYLEGFPFGSLTALLEAVLMGVPPVLAPAQVPLPYRSDDYALENLIVPQTITDYVAQAMRFAGNVEKSAHFGQSLAERVRELHCLPNWAKQLEPLRAYVRSGKRHEVCQHSYVDRLEPSRSEYWAAYVQKRMPDNAFSLALQLAFRRELAPRVDQQLFQALRQARAAGVVRRPARAAAVTQVLSYLPTRTALRLYEKL